MAAMKDLLSASAVDLSWESWMVQQLDVFWAP